VLLGGALGILTAALVGAQLFDVVRVRLEAWLNPWADPSGRSYQIVQSLLAVANGGIFGRGPGMGSPALVPVAHSDFIFATIGEEMGLVGSLGLLLALGLLTVRGLTIALHAPDPFRRYLAAGLTAALIGQSILIVGGNLRLLPLTGVTLPFVSYGGSSLVTSYLSLLLLLRISAVGEQRPAPLPRQRPYLQLGGALLLGLAAAGLAAGWWGVWRAPDLLTRTDNPRRTVADRLAQRGALLDRDNVPLVASEGAPGSFSRLTQPSLSNILGYNDPTYGQTGLEASQDAYLRGLRGYPALETWWNHLLYGYPPAGLSLRLSLDADLQATAEALFPAERGALVLLNSASGEVLTMISRPEFDANTLAENWASLIADPGAPLVNRAVQAQYPSGALLGPFLLAEAQAQGVALPSAAALQAAADSAVCARPPAADLTLANLIAVGCPATAEALAASLGTSAVTALNQRLGLYDAPQIGLEVSAPDDTTRLDPTISPLQAAVAAAALAHDGMRPAPQLVTAVNLPDDGWTSLVTPLTAVPALNADAAAATAARLAVRNTPERTDLWATVVVVSQLAPDYTGPVDPATAWVTWFIGGSLPGSSFQPVALALVIEGRQPEAAYAAGLALLETARR
jgi:hypothetical protein